MRLRFTIRDLLWLAVVVALAVGWRLDRTRLDSELRQRDADSIKSKISIEDVERILSKELGERKFKEFTTPFTLPPSE